MAERFEFFEHTADLGARIQGATLVELFQNAARALVAAWGKLETTGPRESYPVCLVGASWEDLLHDWLSELLYAVETRRVCYDEYVISSLSPFALTATMSGARIDFGRSQVNAEIKAVTYHRLRVTQLPDGTWQATVIFDV